MPFIHMIGDKAIADLKRADGRAFIEKQLTQEKRVATSTVRRRLNTFHAVFNTYLRERDLNIKNPFEALTIPDEGGDTKKRTPFAAHDLNKLAQLCREHDDDIRWLLALIIDTGLRMAEATGLTLADIVLDTEIPYVNIQRHPWRDLKNPGSTRQVPLVGRSLWAAQRIKATAKHSQRMAFPRYTDETECRATAASGALCAWIKGQGLGHTPHELRHSIKDRLRDVECPEDIRFAIGGWASKSVGDQYGLGTALKINAKWLLRIVSSAESSLDN